LGLEFCDVSALQAQDKITGQSRQILFEGLPPQTQDLHGFFRLTSFFAGSQKGFDCYTFCPEGETCQSWKDGDFCVSLVAR
jgi:hypothetical protein